MFTPNCEGPRITSPRTAGATASAVTAETRATERRRTERLMARFPDARQGSAPLRSILPHPEPAGNGLQEFERRPGRRVRVLDVRIQFDGHPAGVPERRKRSQHLLEIDGPGAGHEMLVNTARGDVFQVDVTDVTGQPPRRDRGVFADAIHVADVKVQAYGRRIDVPHELLELLRALDQEARFGFH